MKHYLMPGDIVFTQANTLLGKSIRLFTRSMGESRTKADHCAIVITEGDIDTADIVDAWVTVDRHSIWDYYGKRKHFAIAVFRPKALTDEERSIIIEKAVSYVGRRYGFLKLLVHFLDWLFFGIYFFRRLALLDRYPICSWVVAMAYGAAGKDFGINPAGASPDDIWDYVTEHKVEFNKIRDLKVITQDDFYVDK